jgi:hypothetical protein
MKSRFLTVLLQTLLSILLISEFSFDIFAATCTSPIESARGLERLPFALRSLVANLVDDAAEFGVCQETMFADAFVLHGS